MKKLPALCLLPMMLATLGACTHTVPYQKPATELAPAFKEASLWRPASASSQRIPDAWWQVFNDATLNQLQTELLSGNENLKVSVAQYKQVRAALGLSQAALSPTLGLSATGNRSDSGAIGTTVSNTVNLGASANWEVDLWGRLSGTVVVSQAKLQASENDLAAARLSLQGTLTQTYFSVRTADAQIALLDSTVAAYQRTLDMSQNRYNAGIASAADVALAQTQFKSTQAQLIEARSSRAQLEHALAVLTGKAPTAFSLAVKADLAITPDVPALLPATLLERRPDIAAAERRVAAAFAQTGVAQTAYFPTLNLSGNTGYRGAALADLVNAPKLFWSLGPALALSVFDGGAREAALDSANAGVDQAIASYRQTVLVAFQEVEDNLVMAVRLEEERSVLAESLVAAQKALEVVTNQYKAGTVSYLNVLSGQSQALSVERSLLDARHRKLLATAQLLKNVGGSWR
jgi:NodT family efflux transporter outer membrane factor (OMF) lipoprotein